MANVEYLNLPFAMRPVSHSSEILVTEPSFKESSTDPDNEAQVGTSCPNDDADYKPGENQLLKLINLVNLNDFVRDLNITKESTELLGLSLKEWNLLAPETTFC